MFVLVCCVTIPSCGCHAGGGYSLSPKLEKRVIELQGTLDAATESLMKQVGF